jgi:hypothetical protein
LPIDDIGNAWIFEAAGEFSANLEEIELKQPARPSILAQQLWKTFTNLH